MFDQSNQAVKALRVRLTLTQTPQSTRSQLWQVIGFGSLPSLNPQPASARLAPYIALKTDLYGADFTSRM